MSSVISFYNKILEFLPEAVAIFNSNGKCFYADEKFQSLAGVGVNCEIINEVIPLFDKNEQLLLLKQLNSHADEERSLLKTKIINVQTGKKTDVSCEVLVSNSRKKTHVGIILNVLNKYYKADKRDRDKNEISGLKTALLSHVSHELRTPLTIIKEAVDLIAAEEIGSINQSQKQFVDVALDNIDRLTNIINRIIDMAVLEKNMAYVDIKEIDLSDIVSREYCKFAVIAENKSVNLIHTKGKNFKDLVCSDPEKIVYIIDNILENAIRFSDKGGSVYFSVDCPDKELEIVVKDTGCGIKNNELGMIFDIFYQVNRVYGPGTQGMGLGLAIVQKVTELLNGTAAVSSEENKGTTFTIKIPIDC